MQGSTCIGIDCVDNEAFGFDTLRLKENNLRLKFEDTSSSAGFPSNDWTLIANDSASGGRNYFGLEDTTAGRLVWGVSAGAPAYSMWVNSLGNVGLGTENPLLKMHLVSTNTPAIRFEQTNLGGFTAQTWDVGANEANFFIRDTTGGSQLPFQIRPGAPTGSLNIASTGFVGFGTNSPNYRIDAVQGNASAIRFGGPFSDSGGYLTSTAASNATLSGGASWNGTDWIAKASESSQIRMLNGNLGIFTDSGLTSGTAFTPTARLTVSAGGDVGIGTSAPTAQLHTTGTIRFEALSGCGSGLGTDASGYLSCLGGSGAGLVQQAGPNAPITIGANTGGTLIGVDGTAGNRQITGVLAGNVAAGSTDATNGGQLYTANQRVAAAFGGGAGLDSSGQLTAPSYTVLGETYDNVGGALGALNSQVSQSGLNYLRINGGGAGASATGAGGAAIGSGATASGANALAFGNNAQATQSGAVAIGSNSAATGANAIAIGTGATATGSVAIGFNASASNGGAAYGDGAVATGTNATAIGPNATATAANAVAIGSGSTNSVANTVSVGSAGNERRITNVAAGVSPTDAVNVAQLQSTAAGFQSQIGGLQTQITDNRWEARGGIALALAAGGLQFDQRPGKLSVAGAFGHFKGESGLALGVGYAATERLRFNAAVSGVPSQGSVGGVVSGSITLN